MIFAQLQSVSWNTTGSFVLGLIGVLGVVALILTVVEKARKVFGKTPPFQEQIDSLRKEFAAAIASQEAKHKISVSGAYKKIEEERKDREAAFADLALERARNIKEINEAVLAISKDIAFMRGQISKR